MQIRIGLAAITAVLALFSTSGAAQRFYIGASAGVAHVESGEFARQVDVAYPWMETLEATGAKAETSGGAGRIFVGVRLTDMFALEADYTHLGNIISSHASFDTRPMDPQLSRSIGTQRIESQAQAFGISLVARAPVTERVSILARAGVALTRLDQSNNFRLYYSDTAFQVPRVDFTNSNLVVDETRPTVGLGLDWSLAERIAIRASWDRYFGVGHKYDSTPHPRQEARGEFDIDYFGVGVRYAF